MRISLLFVGMPPVHDDVDTIEPSFEEGLIGLKFERGGHDSCRICKHAVLGDNRVSFYAARIFHRLFTVAVRQANENKHSKDHCGDAERRVLPVPNLGLPHGEVFAGDHHEAEKPEAKADSQSGYCPDL